VHQSPTTIVIPSDLAEAKKPESVILHEVERLGYSSESIFAIKLTIEEGITNAIKHGNKSDKSKKVTVQFSVDKNEISVSIRDEGPGFDPEGVPDPTTEERLALPSGRGILLMRAYMDELTFRNNGTEVFFRKLNR
jgi:serine/threonine-protein kinase RsbW